MATYFAARHRPRYIGANGQNFGNGLSQTSVSQACRFSRDEDNFTRLLYREQSETHPSISFSKSAYVHNMQV